MTLKMCYKKLLVFLLCLPAVFCLADTVDNAVPASAATPAAAPADYGHMQAMDDDELAQNTGQALFNLSYLAPGEAKDKNNNTITSSINSDIGFYTLGLEGKLDLNANIRKLQLGCGGVNGANNCDIDIDNFSISGCGVNVTCTSSSNPTSSDRVSSDATMTNPFIQFAFDNPDDPAKRKLVGFRLGAQNMNGLVTFGTENTADPNGINSLSGYLSLTAAKGAGDVLPINAAYSCSQVNHPTTNCGTYIDPATLKMTTSTGTTVDCLQTRCTIATGTAMLGTGCFYIASASLECSGVAVGSQGNSSYSSTDYILPLSVNTGSTAVYPGTSTSCGASTSANGIIPAGSGRVCFTTNPASFSGTRMTSLAMVGSANVPTINFSCSAACAYTITNYLGTSLDLNLQGGTMSGMNAVALISESLGLFHKMAVNSPFSISLQGQSLYWPGAAAGANTGWWMAFDDPVDPGDISPTKALAFSASTLQQAFCGPNNVAAGGGCTGGASYNGFSTGGTGASGGANDALWYQRGGTLSAEALGALISSQVTIGNVPVAAAVTYPMTNLQLATQGFATNCWNSSKFC